MDAGETIARCATLKSNWSTRNRKMKAWYDILRLKDTLAQKGMESVVSNDPKTGYNLGRHLMTSSIISHKIAIEGLSMEQVAAVAYLETYLHKMWAKEEERYRRTGKQRFTSKLISLMLATGWYSVFAMATKDKVWAEVWNPIEVFPDFGSDGLIEVAHVYPLTPGEANRKLKLQGWTTKNKITNNTALYDYWGFDDNGDAVNAIVMGQEFVKPPEVDRPVNQVIQKTGESVLPVFVSPVGGLPDDGSIVTGKAWQENFGESIVATNEQMTITYNKMLSFIQQAARSAAQHRWFEKSTGDSAILTEENIDKWGAIFRLGPNDEIGPVQPPPIPVELRTAMYEYSNMIQRGLFPWVLHGNLQQQLSYLAMANVASSALQQLTPYVEGVEGVLSDVDNFWLHLLDVAGYRPHGFEKQPELPEDYRVKVVNEIQIPGYLVQRATVARMLNPNFRLPQRWIMDRMFPEIKDSLEAMSQVRSEDAMMDERAIAVDSILAYKEQAARLRKEGESEGARLYEKLAASLESELGIGKQQPPPNAPTMPREVMPSESTEPITGLGEM
jgi:hypothetical protein